MTKWLRNFWKDESGITAIEWGLITALIAIAVIIILNYINPNNNLMQEATGAAGLPAVE